MVGNAGLRLSSGANRAVNPRGGSGGNQRFLAAAGLPWPFATKIKYLFCGSY
ncbi:hypothetical protein Psta_0438 [Pirellula staleyi DSM 6068]|uniref:Uncharacterized protein n=1 Tax=Pirellula staleyi (strain ATCC 27377 / DSM 6068 / ICPB 4128) TaxID=530564 RepID=D2R396_PIRSD|nr:hypothetical protein Psta_0438 [Pirellula staleyi DSM 6068]